MERKDFVLHRVAFAGLPYAAIRAAEAATGPHGWRRGMLGQARLMRRCARNAERQGAGHSAAEYHRWAGVAYHSATLGPDLQELEGLPRVTRLRRMAVASYRRALRGDSNASEVLLRNGSATLAGYFRRPQADPRGVVVLLNGLDSLCEVELHAFGNGLLQRGVATLALDLPARYRSHAAPSMAVEEWAQPLKVWLEANGLADAALGVFGVSFGGYLAARLATCPVLPWRAAVAVSPPSSIEPRHLDHPYFARMLRWTFDAPGNLQRLAAEVTLQGLQAPGCALRVYEMTEDGLFGPAHVDAYRQWGGPRVEVHRVAAEHVGTSRFYCWLPEVFDWYTERFSHA